MSAILRFALAFVAIAVSTVTQAYDFSATAEVRNQYLVGSGVEVTDGHRPFGVLNFHLAFDNGLYANIWQGAETKGLVEGDYAIGYAWKQANNGPWSVDVSLNYYNIAAVSKWGDGDLWTPIVRVDYRLSDHVGLFGAVEGYFYHGDCGGHDGVTSYAGVESTWSVWRQLDLTVGGQAGYDTLDQLDRAFGKGWLKLGWAFSPSTKLSAGYTQYWNGDNNPGFWAVALSHNF